MTSRRRDADRTRRDLLAAASELFAANGYSGTTLRQIGARAGVDPALIVRYFGGKTALFIAALDADWPPRDRTDAFPVAEVVERVVRAGSTPLLAAAIVPSTEDDVRESASRIVEERFIGPLLRELGEADPETSRVQAESIAAAVAGIVLARSTGMLEALAGADDDRIVEVAMRVARCLMES